MRNKQGFTLMEILAVLLVIAVIASFAVPLIKSVRREMRYQKAKAAAVQLAEAVRSFYTDTKGCLATTDPTTQPDGFFGPDAASGTCPEIAKTGIPCRQTVAATAVFGCGYISPKMFVDLPYNFVVEDPRTSENNVFITGTEQGETDGRWFKVNRDMTITEADD